VLRAAIQNLETVRKRPGLDCFLLTTLQSSCWIGFHNLTAQRRIVLLCQTTVLLCTQCEQGRGGTPDTVSGLRAPGSVSDGAQIRRSRVAAGRA
jgi:hypothetical protein